MCYKINIGFLSSTPSVQPVYEFLFSNLPFKGVSEVSFEHESSEVRVGVAVL